MSVFAGTTVRFYTQTPFQTTDGPADPDNVYLAYQISGGNVVVVEYGNPQPPIYATIERVGTGDYYVDINTEAAGIYTYSWIGIGAVDARDEQSLVVEQPSIPFP